PGRGLPRRGLEARSCTKVLFVRAGGDDVLDLPDREVELLLGVEEVWAEAEADIGPEVAEDVPRGELLVHALEARHANGDARAATRLVALRGDLEARPVGEPDQMVGQVERAPADRIDADLLDHVVAGGRGEQRGHARRSRQEAG